MSEDQVSRCRGVEVSMCQGAGSDSHLTPRTSHLPSRAWVAAKGARRFALAIAMGDVADDATVAARRAVCRECPSRVRVAALGAIGVSDWCGEPFVERLDGPVEGRTCGCLLAGKTSVGSEKCGQGKW